MTTGPTRLRQQAKLKYRIVGNQGRAETPVIAGELMRNLLRLEELTALLGYLRPCGRSDPRHGQLELRQFLQQPRLQRVLQRFGHVQP